MIYSREYILPYSYKLLNKYYKGGIKDIKVSNLPLIKKDRKILFKLKIFKKKCIIIPNMEDYAKLNYSGINYILGDDCGVYINRKNKEGLYTNLVGYLDYTDKYNIDWLPGKKYEHDKKVKKYNYKLTEILPISGKSKKVSNKEALDNELSVIYNINDNPIYKKELLEYLLSIGISIQDELVAEKPLKSNNYHIKYTEQWKNYKAGTSETNPSSKTDIILNLIYNISLKSGKGRLTSADCYETSAILLSVWKNKHQDNDKIKEIIDKIIYSMKHVGKHTPLFKHRSKTSICNEMKNDPLLKDEDTEWINKLEQQTVICNNLWKKIKDNHLEYVKDVLFECASGEYKFGDNCGRAKILLVTDNKSIKIKKIYSLEKRTEGLDDYLMYCLPSNCIFASKSAGTGTKMWMRFL